MMDINTLVDNILLSHAAAEDNVCARRSVVANAAAGIIIPFLIAAASVTVLLAAGFMLASIF